MKTFSQFLQEAYLSEELPAGMSRDEFNRLPAETRRRLTGSQSGIGRQGETLRPDQTPLAVRGARRSGNASPEAWTRRNPGKLPIPNPPSTPPSSTPGESLRREAEQVARSSSRRPRLTTTNVPRSNITGTKPQPSAPNYRPGGGRTPSPYSGVTSPSAATRPSGATALTHPTVKPKGSPWFRTIGGLSALYDVGSEFMSQRERGRSIPSSAAIGLTKAAGGLGGGSLGTLGGRALGTVAGAPLGPKGAAAGGVIGGVLGGGLGYEGGSELAGSAAETVAGATPKEKLAMAQANRRRQSGSLIKGVGGPTTVSQKKPGGPAFISTGAGSQRRTTQLPTTSLFKKDGKQSTGYLAFKGGKPVYKQGPSAQTLARTSSNPLERVGRSLFSGAYKQHDIKKGQEAYRTALRNTQQYQKNLGITPQKAKTLGLPGR